MPVGVVVAYHLPSMEPQPFSRGYVGDVGAVQDLIEPSMEPQPFSRGYWDLLDSLCAPAFLQWSHNLSVVDTSDWHDHCMCSFSPFNGATTFQSWIRRAWRRTPLTRSSLQWSHNLSVVDTGTTTLPSPAWRFSFNGATTFQSWIRDTNAIAHSSRESPSMEPQPFSRGYRGSGAGAGRSDGPSMEPQPFSRGYAAYPSLDTLSAKVLQWSHNLSVVDTRLARAPGVADRPPSMEPQPFSRGYFSQPGGASQVPVSLQWSHNLSVVDTSPSRAEHPKSPCPFNGATTFQSWIRQTRAFLCGRARAFNGATTFQSWIQVGARDGGDSMGPSMEPQPFSRGYDCQSLGWQHVRESFNGATTFQSWIQHAVASDGK